MRGGRVGERGNKSEAREGNECINEWLWGREGGWEREQEWD